MRTEDVSAQEAMGTSRVRGNRASGRGCSRGGADECVAPCGTSQSPGRGHSGLCPCTRGSRIVGIKMLFSQWPTSLWWTNCVRSGFVSGGPMACATEAADGAFRADLTVPLRVSARGGDLGCASPSRLSLAPSWPAWCRSVVGSFRAPVFKMHVDGSGRSGERFKETE